MNDTQQTKLPPYIVRGEWWQDDYSGPFGHPYDAMDAFHLAVAPGRVLIFPGVAEARHYLELWKAAANG